MKNNLPNSLLCQNCYEKAPIFFCNKYKKQICIECCNDYQLSAGDITLCISCTYLVRDLKFFPSLNNRSLVLSSQYNNHFVFDTDIENLTKKSIQMYKKYYMKDYTALFNLSERLYYNHNYEESLFILMNIKHKINSSYDYFKLTGDLYLSLNNYEKAIDSYFKSLDYNKTSYVYRRIAECHSSLNLNDRALYYHEKALEEYSFSNENDFLYFTNYYSLALIYSNLKNYDFVIKNALEFLNFYGDFSYIQDRISIEIDIIGDLFMKDIVLSTYKLLALTYYEAKEYELSKTFIEYTKKLDCYDLDLAKISGYCEAKLEDKVDVEKMLEELRISGKMNIMILNGGTLNMKLYNTNNTGTMQNVNIGENNSINLADSILNEIEEFLLEINKNKEKINLDNHDEIITDIKFNLKTKDFSTLKANLNNLLLGIASGCIANGIPHLVSSLTEILNKI